MSGLLLHNLSGFVSSLLACDAVPSDVFTAAFLSYTTRSDIRGLGTVYPHKGNREFPRWVMVFLVGKASEDVFT